MGKRSDFERNERDYYPTPYKAVEPLLPHLPPNSRFNEPCAGDGRLVDHLQNNGHICHLALDIEPQREDIIKADIFDSVQWSKYSIDYVITNPPWERKILHPMIERFIELDVATWLLFDADWMHTIQSAKYMKYVSDIVSIGRVKWIENSKNTGKDNCCWYLFQRNNMIPPRFHGRQIK